ncbi:MAG: serine hydrolase [Acidovorax sp.]|uniref:serine hydrolase n=1 Tax=Acidovorax sp. TaxID=1872122 RepID=UPI0012FB9487|nr:MULTISPECIES: serine hydrolase [Comamonadaceae]MDH4426236.1 serine hydrolase [Acidovorax sp.]
MTLKRILIQLGVAGFLVSSLLLSQDAAATTKQKKVVAKATATKVQANVKSTRNKKQIAKSPRAAKVVAVAPKPSYGQLAGLHGKQDALDLKSSVAFVVDQDTKEVLFSKNENAVLPIASITKLMTGVVVSEARLSMDETIEITQADVDTEKGSSSRLRVGTELSRGELLHLALMASENRAAHALGRTFPGGLQHFVGLMNQKARILGMTDTQYVEPTGLNSRNQSSAKDLATLVNYAYSDATLRELSTSTGYQVEVGNRTLQYNNTNRLVKNPAWEIGLQKTGYITEAGQCLVMQAKIAGRKLIMVFLDSAGKLTRIADAERVRKWVETGHPATGTKSSPLALRGFDSRIATN